MICAQSAWHSSFLDTLILIRCSHLLRCAGHLIVNELQLLFAAVRDGHWYWGLGDPDLGAVLVTGLYFLAGAVCFVVARQVGGGKGGWSQECEAPTRPYRLLTPGPVFGDIPQDQWRREIGEAPCWLVLGGLLLCLGVNKQADLQTLLTLYGRDVLRLTGQYEARRTIQIFFIIAAIFVAFGSVMAFFWVVQRLSWCCRAAAAGLALQMAFLVIRAASFHHVDILLGLRLGDLKLNLLLESMGLFVILQAAMFRWAAERA